MREQDDMVAHRLKLAAIALAVVIVVAVALVQLTGGSTADGSGEPTAASGTPSTAQGELVAGPAAAGDTGSQPAAAGGGVAPLAVREDEASRSPAYGSESVVVDSEPPTSPALVHARRLLEQATSGIHECERDAQARHRRLGRPGRVDPMPCVYRYTAIGPEEGPVRMDAVTKNGYGYSVEGPDGRIYRYSEFDGNACRSIDNVAPCGAW